jgi:hypothetical protein
MTLAELKASRTLHARRHRLASGKLARVRRDAHADHQVTAAEAREIHRLERRVREQRALVDRREAQIAAKEIGSGTLFLPGVKRVPGNHAGTFVPSPPKLVWHTTEGSSIDGAIGAYRQHNSWPHFTLDTNSGRLVQHLPMNRAGRALEHRRGTVETNRAHAIQVELVGSARESSGWPARSRLPSACRGGRWRRSPSAASGSGIPRGCTGPVTAATSTFLTTTTAIPAH